MRITALGSHKGNTWKLELDDSGELHFLHVSIVQQYQLRQGMALTPAEWERVQQAELSRKAYQYACYLLDSRGYSYQAMFHKLEPKYPEAVCYAVVNRLVKYGQINDRVYAEQTAHHYIEVKHFGFYRARQEMRRRGLLDAQIDEALEPYAERTEEILMELVRRKYQSFFLDPDDRRMVEKGKAALVRQGYSFHQINAAVGAFFEENDGYL